ncbi:hypothetical protein KIL84_008660 [Mauremys mutica]|uniref:Uncharacterized protein n=1 Tax=Mauremys mutica TaxID=74926 RepID=A0A9D3X3B2_9SAUR|nr:hypothetical protein KIL84_008660 [Mauremys mutica]
MCTTLGGGAEGGEISLCLCYMHPQRKACVSISGAGGAGGTVKLSPDVQRLPCATFTGELKCPYAVSVLWCAPSPMEGLKLRPGLSGCNTAEVKGGSYSWARSSVFDQPGKADSDAMRFLA